MWGRGRWGQTRWGRTPGGEWTITFSASGTLTCTLEGGTPVTTPKPWWGARRWGLRTGTAVPSSVRQFSSAMSATGTLTATLVVTSPPVSFACAMSAAGTLTVAVQLLAGVFNFTGDFPDGAVLVIDLDKKTVTLDGANALADMTGDFFKISPGDNQIVYTDSEGARSVAASVTHKDRWA